MDTPDTVITLSALAQPTRLEAFRLLVGSEPDGIPAGDLARQLGVPQNTLSSHLSILAQAGLVRGERQSRSIIYRADLAKVRDVMMFMLAECCNGHPDICTPVRQSLELISTSQPSLEPKACC